MPRVLQTDQFEDTVQRLGITEDELHEIVLRISEDPTIGETIPGTGGIRRWRVATSRGSEQICFRNIGYFGGNGMPVFLLDIVSRGERFNLSQVERSKLKMIVGDIADHYRSRVKREVAGSSEASP